MVLRESPKSLLNRGLLFLGLQNLFGRRTRARDALSVSRSVWLLIQGHCRKTMPSSPPAQAVQNLGKCDLEDPGLQCSFTFETADISKHLQEGFLNGVGRLRRISEHAVGDMKNGSAIRPDKFVVRCILI